MFKTRLLSGILLVIIALATIVSGDYVLFFTLLAVSLIGMRELYRAMKVQDEKINLLAVAGYLGAVLYYLAVLLDLRGMECWQSFSDLCCSCLYTCSLIQPMRQGR